MSKRSGMAEMPLELSCLTEQPTSANKSSVRIAVAYLRLECEKAKAAGDSGKVKRLQQGEAMLTSVLRGVTDAQFSRTMAGAIKYLAVEWGMATDKAGPPMPSAASTSTTSRGNASRPSEKPMSKPSNYELMNPYHCLLRPKVQQRLNASRLIQSAERTLELQARLRKLQVRPRTRKRPRRRTNLVTGSTSFGQSERQRSCVSHD